MTSTSTLFLWVGRSAFLAASLLGACASGPTNTNAWAGSAGQTPFVGAGASTHDDIVRARYEADSARQQLAISEQRNAMKSSDLALADATAKQQSLRAELGCARIFALEKQLQRANAQMPQLTDAYAVGNGTFNGCQVP